MKEELRLYVWEFVYGNIGTGLAVALASSVEQARAEVMRHYLEFWGISPDKPFNLGGDYERQVRVRAEEYLRDLINNPKVYDSPVGFFEFGD